MEEGIVRVTGVGIRCGKNRGRVFGREGDRGHQCGCISRMNQRAETGEAPGSVWG